MESPVTDVAARPAPPKVVQELRDFLAETSADLRARWGRSTSFDARLDWQRTLAAGGWAALGWPEEFGGRGLGVRDRVACGLELAAAWAPVLAGVLGINNVGPALMAFGSEDQQVSLPRILTTEEIWCQGFSEPGAGSDLASLRTRAVADGDDFVINGQKIWTSEGMEATHCLLLARTDPDAPKHRGISALTIRMDTPGIERRPIRMITGESGFAEVFFTDVRVPRSSLLGPLHRGWDVTMATLAHERAGVIGLAAELEHNVTAELSGALSTTSAAEGPQAPLLRQEIARRYADARIAGLLGLRALADEERGAPPGPEQTLIKLAWGSAVESVATTLLEAAGPDAQRAGDASMAYLRAPAATIAGGTTEVLKTLVGERVLGLPREPRPV